jgi:hypothetical protein
MDDVDILNVGICSIQVCVDNDLSDQQILNNLNRTYPSGTTNGWMQVERKIEGQTPVPCNTHQTRTHFIINC